ncbi:uncharacterized protein TRIREDRAFT_80052 [Trichoderma reesei QM6a]|uniref:Predicted protein n=2 Tax=Hypocrea jecorina TaxID=51453 RepID=G0RPR3_HYPJQ|nr:uncharacterized protein TRIREDRAFT_80052 [Trichoderma reesei QM6a]EGR46901.1 predicted protein [Trichoderma reesei QM6a]ETS00510.1 hypothetical protein M419DRAFT_83617 [Trichoderma reesei RUT C-30]
MPSKREAEDTGGDTPEPQTKRAKMSSSKTRQHQHSGIDPTWGQKYVFSGTETATTIPEGEESEFEDDTDAMAYLLSVRQQAYSIPHLLVAPPVQIGPQLPPGFDREEDESEEEGEMKESYHAPDTSNAPESNGFYEDGAYIGITEGWRGNGSDQDDVPDEENPEAIQRAVDEAYFASILHQYHHLRKILHTEPPANAARRLSRSQATEALSFGRSTITLWSRLLKTTDPHPVQVALMSKDTVLKILRVMMSGKFLRSGYSIPPRTSQWLWALLARLPAMGELNHAEISWIRDLGRRAVLLGRSLAEMAALREELADSGFGVNDNVDASSSDEEVVAETIEEGDEEGDDDGDALPAVKATATKPPASAHRRRNSSSPIPDDVTEAKEGSEDEDVAMDTASDSSADEGEIPDQPDEATALEEAKHRLLARLAESENERRKEEERRDARMNMRATLTMILTVAGEFYGQRDLLEFREPFVGM